MTREQKQTIGGILVAGAVIAILVGAGWSIAESFMIGNVASFGPVVLVAGGVLLLFVIRVTARHMKLID